MSVVFIPSLNNGTCFVPNELRNVTLKFKNELFHTLNRKNINKTSRISQISGPSISFIDISENEKRNCDCFQKKLCCCCCCCCCQPKYNYIQSSDKPFIKCGYSSCQCVESEYHECSTHYSTMKCSPRKAYLSDVLYHRGYGIKNKSHTGLKRSQCSSYKCAQSNQKNSSTFSVGSGNFLEDVECMSCKNYNRDNCAINFNTITPTYHQYEECKFCLNSHKKISSESISRDCQSKLIQTYSGRPQSNKEISAKESGRIHKKKCNNFREEVHYIKINKFRADNPPKTKSKNTSNFIPAENLPKPQECTATPMKSGIATTLDYTNKREHSTMALKLSNSSEPLKNLSDSLTKKTNKKHLENKDRKTNLNYKNTGSNVNLSIDIKGNLNKSKMVNVDSNVLDKSKVFKTNSVMSHAKAGVCKYPYLCIERPVLTHPGPPQSCVPKQKIQTSSVGLNEQMQRAYKLLQSYEKLLEEYNLSETLTESTKLNIGENSFATLNTSLLNTCFLFNQRQSRYKPENSATNIKQFQHYDRNCPHASLDRSFSTPNHDTQFSKVANFQNKLKHDLNTKISIDYNVRSSLGFLGVKSSPTQGMPLEESSLGQESMLKDKTNQTELTQKQNEMSADQNIGINLGAIDAGSSELKIHKSIPCGTDEFKSTDDIEIESDTSHQYEIISKLNHECNLNLKTYDFFNERVNKKVSDNACIDKKVLTEIVTKSSPSIITGTNLLQSTATSGLSSDYSDLGSGTGFFKGKGGFADVHVKDVLERETSADVMIVSSTSTEKYPCHAQNDAYQGVEYHHPFNDRDTNNKSKSNKPIRFNNDKDNNAVDNFIMSARKLFGSTIPPKTRLVTKLTKETHGCSYSYSKVKNIKEKSSSQIFIASIISKSCIPYSKILLVTKSVESLQTNVNNGRVYRLNSSLNKRSYSETSLLQVKFASSAEKSNLSTLKLHQTFRAASYIDTSILTSKIQNHDGQRKPFMGNYKRFACHQYINYCTTSPPTLIKKCCRNATVSCIPHIKQVHSFKKKTRSEEEDK